MKNKFYGDIRVLNQVGFRVDANFFFGADQVECKRFGFGSVEF